MTPVDALTLDSSVAVKWFRAGERDHAAALALRQAYLDGHVALYVPDLLVYEVANALRYKDDLTAEQVQAAAQSLLDMGLAVVPVAGPLIQQAIRLARDLDVTVYDAVFVALAETLGTPLVSADERLLHQAAHLAHVHALSDISIAELLGT